MRSAGVLFRTPVAWGALLWFVLLWVERPDVHHDLWARLLLLLAVLVWIPLAIFLLNPEKKLFRGGLLPAGAGLVVSLQLPAGWAAFIWALPWAVVIALVFADGLRDLVRRPGPVGSWALTAARIFLVVGGVAVLTDRLGLQPLGFDPAIILLTAVHFHYAGFILPLLLGWAALRWPSPFWTWNTWLMLLTVPLTAAGITLTYMTKQYYLESVAAVLVSLSGWGIAFGYVQAWRQEKLPFVARLCWGIMAICLLLSMTLSCGYALRAIWPAAALNLPAMRAIHGTANALGVAGGGLLGWYFLSQPHQKTNI